MFVSFRITLNILYEIYRIVRLNITSTSKLHDKISVGHPTVYEYYKNKSKACNK